MIFILKKTFGCLIIILFSILIFPFVSESVSKIYERTLSLHHENILVKDLIKLIEKEFDIKINIDESYNDKRITIIVRNVTLDDLVKIILKRIDVSIYAIEYNDTDQTITVHEFQKNVLNDEFSRDPLDEVLAPPLEPEGKGITLREYNAIQEAQREKAAQHSKVDEVILPPDPFPGENDD